MVTVCPPWNLRYCVFGMESEWVRCWAPLGPRVAGPWRLAPCGVAHYHCWRMRQFSACFGVSSLDACSRCHLWVGSWEPFCRGSEAPLRALLHTYLKTTSMESPVLPLKSFLGGEVTKVPVLVGLTATLSQRRTSPQCGIQIWGPEEGMFAQQRSHKSCLPTC